MTIFLLKKKIQGGGEQGDSEEKHKNKKQVKSKSTFFSDSKHVQGIQKIKHTIEK